MEGTDFLGEHLLVAQLFVIDRHRSLSFLPEDALEDHALLRIGRVALHAAVQDATHSRLRRLDRLQSEAFIDKHVHQVATRVMACWLYRFLRADLIR